jgi:hypothetical protein
MTCLWRLRYTAAREGFGSHFQVIFNGANSVANTLFGFFIFNGIKWLGFYLSPASVPNNKKARLVRAFLCQASNGALRNTAFVSEFP